MGCLAAIQEHKMLTAIYPEPVLKRVFSSSEEVLASCRNQAPSLEAGFSPHINYSPSKAIFLLTGRTASHRYLPTLQKWERTAEFPSINSHGVFKFLIHLLLGSFLKPFQDSRVLFSFLKMLILFPCLLSKILSQLRQAEFPFWAYQYSSGLSTRDVSSFKSRR